MYSRTSIAVSLKASLRKAPHASSSLAMFAVFWVALPQSFTESS